MPAIDLSDLTRVLGLVQRNARKDSKLTTWAGRGLLAASVFGHARSLHDTARERLDYTVTVEAGDPIYRDALVWVLQQLPPQRRRAVRAAVELDDMIPVDDDPFVDGDHVAATAIQRRATVRFVHDGSRAAWVAVDGHRVKVEVTREAVTENWGRSSEHGDYRSQRDPGSVKFTTRTPAGRDAVMALLQSMADRRYNHADDDGETIPIMPVWVMNHWGHWTRCESLGRTLDTVVLADGVVDGVVADLTEFLAAEDAYIRTGLPWHRGYLFHGPPGSGKSSMPRALALAFGMPIYTINLPDLKADADLMQSLSEVRPRSLLLIEDIDVARAAKDRDGTDTGVSLSGLLNALDGVATPHGLITIMSTNHIESLDPALIRSGRADVTIEFGLPDRAQFVDLVAMVTGLDAVLLEAELPELPEGVPHAQIVGWMRNHLMGDPWDAVKAVQGVITAGAPYPPPPPDPKTPGVGGSVTASRIRHGRPGLTTQADRSSF